MKALLALIGVGASLFALMHVLGLIGTLTSSGGGAAAGQFGPTRLLAHVVGMAFGLLIAFVCFRKCAAGNKPAAPAEFED